MLIKTHLLSPLAPGRLSQGAGLLASCIAAQVRQMTSAQYHRSLAQRQRKQQQEVNLPPTLFYPGSTTHPAPHARDLHNT